MLNLKAPSFFSEESRRDAYTLSKLCFDVAFFLKAPYTNVQRVRSKSSTLYSIVRLLLTNQQHFIVDPYIQRLR